MLKKSQYRFLLVLSVGFVTSLVVCYVGFENAEKPKQNAITCGKYVHVEKIFTDNLVWQVLETPFGFLNLLNAYLDARWNRTIVRINVIAPPINIQTHTFFCQFWFGENSQPIVVKASEFQTLWFNSKH